MGLATMLMLGAPALQAGFDDGAQRDRAYWIRIVESDYAVPDGANAFELLVEMNALLGSPDPVLRDRVAYGAAARWIYRERRLSPPELTRLLALWSGNLTAAPATRGAEAVLLRSFSALNLSLLAALDNAAPFMTQAEFERLLDLSLAYLAEERDGRGYEAETGWFHAAAHAADLLKFLARNQKLPRPAQVRLLEAVSQKCSAAAGVFAWGEDERLAQVVGSVVRRADADIPAFEGWLARFPALHREVWADAPAVDPTRFAALQNAKLMLRALFVTLSIETGLPEQAGAARRAVGETLVRMQ